MSCLLISQWCPFSHSWYGSFVSSLFCLISLPRGLILYFFPDNQLLVSLIFRTVHFLFRQLLLFIISFFLIILHLICFPHFLRREFRSFILNIYSLFNISIKAKMFPPTTFAASHIFWHDIFSLSFSSEHFVVFLVSTSLIHGLFRSLLLDSLIKIKQIKMQRQRIAKIT